MTKKSHIINIITLVLIASSAAFADDSNNLVQLDLKRTSDNSVDVTLFTTDSYGDNVMVKKKSDTKYVILVPKVQSSGYKASSLYGVNDLVSNIDVKTVEDTTGGYTKVTLITKKPLDIKTKTQKSVPATAEQKEYNSLIAQANSVRNNISNKAPALSAPQKTEVTVNKAPAAPKEAQKAEAVPKNDAGSTQKSAQKPKIELKEITPDKALKPVAASNPIQTAKQDKSLEELALALPVDAKIQEDAENPTVVEEQAKSEQPIKTKKSHKLPKALGVGAIILVMLSLLSKLFKNQAVRYANQEMYMETNDMQNSAGNSEEAVTNGYESDSNLSWREKYRLYLDKGATPVKRVNKQGSYSFIKSPAKHEINEIANESPVGELAIKSEKTVAKSQIDKKRQALEKMVTLPRVDFNKIEPEIVEVQSEDVKIAQTVKLKAFENNRQNSLRMTNRRSRFRGFADERPLHEIDTVKLEESALTSNKRDLKDANLKVSDVDKRRITYEPKEYIMSSVDEYLSLLDKEQGVSKTQAKEVVKPVVETVSRKEHMTKPVQKSDKPALGKGIVIKSQYKIAPDKGIYMLNKNGKNALVGKVNDKTFVLKRFDGAVTDTISVRQDKDNVYMVKAGRYKSLVEVKDDKMGVLIEL